MAELAAAAAAFQRSSHGPAGADLDVPLRVITRASQQPPVEDVTEPPMVSGRQQYCCGSEVPSMADHHAVTIKDDPLLADSVIVGGVPAVPANPAGSPAGVTAAATEPDLITSAVSAFSERHPSMREVRTLTLESSTDSMLPSHAGWMKQVVAWLMFLRCHGKLLNPHIYHNFLGHETLPDA